jgi:zinc protease
MTARRPPHARTAVVALALCLALPAALHVQAAQAPDRSTPPATGPVPSLTLPPIARHALPNGLAVWLIERHDIPIVDVSVVIRAGADNDPAGRYGLASFTAAMLDEGAGDRDAVDFAEAVARTGATIAADATYDATTIHLHVLASRLDAALPFLADEVLRPTFASAALERVRQDRLTRRCRDCSSARRAGTARRLPGRAPRRPPSRRPICARSTTRTSGPGSRP